MGFKGDLKVYSPKQLIYSYKRVYVMYTLCVVLQLRVGRIGDKSAENGHRGGKAYCCWGMSDITEKPGDNKPKWRPPVTARVSADCFFLFFYFANCDLLTVGKNVYPEFVLILNWKCIECFFCMGM